MAGLKLMAMGGYVPRVAPHLLNDNEAQKALNTKLYAGDLRAWNKPGSLDVPVFVSENTTTIYKGRDTSNDARWIAWDNDVDVAKSPIPGSEYMNIFYTGDGVPKKTNSTLCGSTEGTSPAAYYKMGVPAPTQAPTVARNGSGASPETRVYVFTYINSYGGIEEESAPSPVSAEVLCGTGDTVTVNNFGTAPTSNLNITKRRIYRSVAGTGSTQFQFVTELPVATTTYTDNVSSAGLGEVLASQFYEEPPSNMKGVIALPNGFLAGFFGQTLCFSEVNAPHAWPSTYQINVGYDIVGIAAFGQSIAVMTKGYPYVASGVTPESMTLEKVAILEPCVAKRSITSDNTGVTYASPNGLVGIGPGQAGLMTGNVMLKNDFEKFNPQTLRSAFFAGKYFGFFNDGTETIADGAFILDRNLSATPLSLTTLVAQACFVDPEDGNMYVVEESEIKEWEGDLYNNLPYEWVSKRFVFTAPANLGAIEVEADFDSIEEAEILQERVAQLIAQNQAIWASNVPLQGMFGSQVLNYFGMNGSILNDIPENVDDRYLLVEVSCDDELIYTGQYTQRGVYRLPSGHKGQSFVIKVNGNIELRYLKMAETVKELKTL
jgi:hypothetical protein